MQFLSLLLLLCASLPLAAASDTPTSLAASFLRGFTKQRGPPTEEAMDRLLFGAGKTRLEEAKLEMAFDSERISLSRSKLEKAFLKGLAVENIALKGFANGLRVRSFRTTELAPWQKEAMEHVHALIDKEQKSKQRAAAGPRGGEGFAAGDEEGDEAAAPGEEGVVASKSEKVSKMQERLLKRQARAKEWAEFNEAAVEKFNTDTLQPCPHCGRTFLPERLQVHLRSCGKGHFSDPKVRERGTDGGATDRSEKPGAFPAPTTEGNLGSSARQRRDASPKPPLPASAARSGGRVGGRVSGGGGYRGGGGGGGYRGGYGGSTNVYVAPPMSPFGFGGFGFSPFGYGFSPFGFGFGVPAPLLLLFVGGAALRGGSEGSSVLLASRHNRARRIVGSDDRRVAATEAD